MTAPAQPVQGVEAVAVKPLEWSEIERDRGDGQTDKPGEWEERDNG